MRRNTRLRAALLMVGAALMLAGCLPVPLPQLPPAENDREPVAGPAGWTEFEHCPAGPNDDWIWVDGFPSDAFEAAGIAPDCGDTWIEDDGDSFVNVTATDFTEESLDAFGAELESLGYELLFDNFEPVGPNAPRVGAGARDYYLDGVHTGDFTMLAIEIYVNGTDPASYTGFIDFHSPKTRAL